MPSVLLTPRTVSARKYFIRDARFSGLVARVSQRLWRHSPAKADDVLHLLVPTLIAALAALCLPRLSAQIQNPDWVARQVRERDAGRDSRAEMRMRLFDRQGRVRERSMTLLALRGTGEIGDRLLVRFTYPNDIKGTGFLVWEHPNADDERFLYLPALGRVRPEPVDRQHRRGASTAARRRGRHRGPAAARRSRPTRRAGRRPAPCVGRPLLRGDLVSDDGTVTAIVVTFDEDRIDQLASMSSDLVFEQINRAEVLAAEVFAGSGSPPRSPVPAACSPRSITTS